MVAASSKGLGFGIARELAKNGATVCIASRTKTEIEKAAEASNNNDDANANVTLDQFIDNSFKKWGWLSQKEFQQFRERTKKEISWLHRAVLRQSSKTDILELTNKDKQSLHY